MLVLTRTIARHELKPLIRFLKIDDLLEGARKVKKGLAVEIRQPRKLQNIRFYKVRIGARNNARMIVFMKSEKKSIVPVLIRLKKDKVFGMNMAMNSPIVVNHINRNLIRIFDDIQNKDYQEFTL